MKDQYVLPILADMVVPVWVVILDQDFYASAQLAVGEPFVKVNCILFSIGLLIILLKGSSYKVILDNRTVLEFIDNWVGKTPLNPL